MARLFGIETEYGIAVEGKGAGDLIQESIALVRSYRGRFADRWNYRGEDSRRDMRGFTVERLSTNPDDAQFDLAGTPKMGHAEERSDRVLPNGARLYNDHGHPEYATPECCTLQDLVAHDRAGERILLECAERRAEEIKGEVHLYKNNTDYHGASYGTHECYLMNREAPTDTLIRALAPFLATRQIFAGAGKVGVEVDRRPEVGFQLSQRADFMSVVASVDTLHNRPLVNTRDEPHASPTKYRRLHVIAGDANMSEWATAMKVGTTELTVRLIEDGFCPKVYPKDPVALAKSVSREPSLGGCIEVEGGQRLSAIELQRVYAAEARVRLAGSSADADWTLDEWDRVLDDLETDWTLVADRVDWAAKRMLLEQFMKAESLTWQSPMMQSLDLAYHDIDPSAGLYYGLEQSGGMRRIVTDEAVASARTCPPQNTRAFLRGLFVRQFAEEIHSVGWNGISFRYEGEDWLFDMNPLVGEDVAALNEKFAGVETLADAVRVIRSRRAQASPA